MKISLITVTKNRPKTFDVLQHWIERQDYKGKYEWVVVNDSEEDTYNYRLGQRVIRRKDEGDCPSICGNWIEAVKHVRGDRCVIIEDDDYYAPSYLRRTLAELEDVTLFGWSRILYYNVRFLTARRLMNVSYTALAATAFKCSVLARMEHMARKGNPWIDGLLWDGFKGKSKLIPLTDTKPLMVGIKGIGEGGVYGSSHTDPDFGRPDPNGTLMRQWLGQDEQIYWDFWTTGTLSVT